jgi:hypothetical protein
MAPVAEKAHMRKQWSQNTWAQRNEKQEKWAQKQKKAKNEKDLPSEMSDFDPFALAVQEGGANVLREEGWRLVHLFAGGDMQSLLIPKGWWHCVRSTPQTIGQVLHPLP